MINSNKIVDFKVLLYEWIEVTAAEAKAMRAHGIVSAVEGSNHMDGETALWFSRIRHLDSDFYRTDRQKKYCWLCTKR